MNGHHFVSYYNCGAHVAAQCRCPGPKQKEVTNTPCPVCVGAQIASARADGAFEDIKARAKKAERRVEELEQERLLRDAEMAEEGIAIGKQRAYDAARVQIDEARTKQRQAEARAVKLQADLDAAVDVLWLRFGGTLVFDLKKPYSGQIWGTAWQRVAPLLEKRRERRD